MQEIKVNQTPIAIKAKYLSEVRRFRINDNNLSWEYLKNQLLNTFPLTNSFDLIVKYEDDENELITISSDEELHLAASSCTDSNSLKLYVTSSAGYIQPFISSSIKLAECNSVENARNRNKRIPISDRKGFEENLKTLQEFGFNDARLNFNAMKRFYFGEQDLSKVIDFLCDKSERRRLATERKRKRCDGRNNGNFKATVCNEKQKIREEKRLLREEKKKQRIEASARRKNGREEQAAIHEDINSIEWDEINELYLDGNNMLFLCSFLRNNVLKQRGGRKQMESLLAEIAREFGKYKGLKKVVMIYDSTRLSIHQKGDSSIGIPEFVLCSARPAYKTSDDRLVDWAKERDEEENHSCIYVTSDRELCRRLKENGVKLLKPKAWLTAAVQEEAGELEVDLDSWLQTKMISLENSFSSLTVEEEHSDSSTNNTMQI